jgi:predicted outer membrane repeat protein
MKTHLRFLTMIFLAFTLAFSAIGVQYTPAQASSHIIYVKANAAGADNGSDWSNAYRYLQDALAAATSGDQIWVAEGLYHPDKGAGVANDDPEISFVLKDGVEMYGGFAGTETLLSQRDVNANPTILSGDIDENDVNTDGNHIAETAADIAGSNSYHVVRADATTTSSSILDGFIITAGHADGNIFGYIHGGGLFNWSGSPTLRNLTFSGNSASLDNFGYGGGMYNYNAPDPIQITNVVFTGNRAYQGGGMANGLATTIVTDSTFINNTASSLGGGMAGSESGNTLTNVSFINNTSTGGGGMFASGDQTFINVTFTGNTSTSGGGLFHINGSPVLTNITFNGNTAATAGGLYAANSSNPTLANATFTNNTADTYGGGLYTVTNSNVTLVHVTFSGNSAGTNGGGLRANNSTITLKNTIIADSVSGGDCTLSASGVIGAGSTNNLIEDTGSSACNLTHGVDGNIIGLDPKLGPLADNGGFTQTHALLVGSPAIDAGDDAICAAVPVNHESQNGVARPGSTHCDIGAYEKPLTFTDVPFNHSAWQYIEAIYNAGITGGCTTTPLNYCPNNTVTRAQMAIFLLRGIHGSSYTPPAVGDDTGFNDVPTTHSAAAWIKQLAAEGITGGCGGGNYCPSQAVTRAQMAIFLLRAKYGDDYVPPAVGDSSGFNDVPAASSTAPWIKQLAAEGITGGCGGGNYCPNNPVTRAQMAIFLQRAFNLPLP